MGFVCSKRGKPANAKCAFCGTVGEHLLCDGPREGGKTCDAKMCRRCAVGVPALDVDFCPDCVKQGALTCAARGASSIPCRGPEVNGHLCLAHEMLFTHWMRDEGGSAVYAAPGLPLEAKRRAFHDWAAANHDRAAQYLRRRFREAP